MSQSPTPMLDLMDFDPDPVTVTILPDEDSLGVVDIQTPISVVDDAVNEATEQVFTVELRVINSVNITLVDLSQLSVSLCRIIDNDRKYKLFNAQSQCHSI